MKINYLKFFYFVTITVLLALTLYLIFKLSLVYYYQSLIHTEYLILLVLFSLIIFFFILFFNNSNFIVIVISCIFTLYFCEIFLFLKKNEVLYLKHLISGDEEFQKLKIVNPNKNISKWIGPSYVYQNQDFDSDFLPLGSVSNSLVVYCNEQNYWVTYDSDRFGFNNFSYIDYKQYDFLIIGDSFAEGACMQQKQTIQANLNSTGMNGVSLGKGGNSTLLNYAIFREYFNFFKPKYLIWLHYENDIGGITQEMRSKILRKYLYDDDFKQNLIFRQKEIDLYLNSFFDKKNNNVSLHVSNDNDMSTFRKILEILKFTKIREVIKTFAYSVDEKNYELFRIIMQKTRDTAIKHESKFIFFYTPAYEEIYKIKRAKKMELERHKIFKILNDLNIDYFDLTEEVFFDPNNNYFPDLPDKDYSFHYNPYAYKLISDFIYSKLH